MYLFELVSIEPLEPYEHLKYHTFTNDGVSLFFLEQAGPRIAEHCENLQYVQEHCASRAYTSICYDHAERCYWACTNKSSDLIYKLSSSFHEIDRFSFCGYEICLGPVRAISYDRQNDCLILTFSRKVITVDKHSLCELAAHHCDCAQSFQSCICSSGFHYYISRNCSSDMLTVARDGQTLIHSCLPHGHRILAMTEICDTHGPVINLLSVKHGTYYYLLRGILVHGKPAETKPSHICTCPQRRESTCTDHINCDSPDQWPHHCQNGLCREPCDHVHTCYDHHTHGPNEQDHLHSDWEYCSQSCAAVIESVAL